MAAYNPKQPVQALADIERRHAEFAALARAQGVGPLDVDAMRGTWPGAPDDGFEEAIDALRGHSTHAFEPH